jgi:hypothetical protein
VWQTRSRFAYDMLKIGLTTSALRDPSSRVGNLASPPCGLDRKLIRRLGTKQSRAMSALKKIFGLQRHKLLMGDRHESDIDVIGPYLCAVRCPSSNAR